MKRAVIKSKATKQAKFTFEQWLQMAPKGYRVNQGTLRGINMTIWLDDLSWLTIATAASKHGDSFEDAASIMLREATGVSWENDADYPHEVNERFEKRCREREELKVLPPASAAGAK